MLSRLKERLEGEGVKGEAGPRRTGGGKLRAIPPKGSMNLRHVPHRPVMVQVSGQPTPIGRDAPAQQEGSDPLGLGWNEASGGLGQSQLGLIKYNQNLKSRAGNTRVVREEQRASLSGEISSCVTQTHLVPMTEIYVSNTKQPLQTLPSKSKSHFTLANYYTSH